MTQDERRTYLIGRLLEEREDGRSLPVPGDAGGQRRLLRALMNVRAPAPADERFLAAQDANLQAAAAEKGVTRLADLTPLEPGLYLWRGDITALAADAIVNAANAGMTGCYVPGHNCIDNCIHTFAGVQLRLECARLMAAQGHEEPAGTAKITPAYNLPCRYVLHTVGPIVDGAVTAEDRRLLESCYRACLELAAAHGLHSVAFCCVSTGVFRFPKRQAAEIAVRTVRRYRQPDMDVIFNVHSEENYAIYRQLLG